MIDMTNLWLLFEIEELATANNRVVRHRITCTSSADSVVPAPCHFVTITSQAGRLSNTASVSDAAVCELDIVLGKTPYRGSILKVAIRQTAESDEEIYTARHMPGAPLKAACRLNSLLTDMEAWRYLASNIDVAEVVGTDLKGARSHYSDYGRYEGRTFAFEPLSYLASHPDLSVFGEDEIAACEHFVTIGRREGRQITFKPKRYLERYADLRDAYGTDENAAVLHYLRIGRSEGRTIE